MKFLPLMFLAAAALLSSSSAFALPTRIGDQNETAAAADVSVRGADGAAAAADVPNLVDDNDVFALIDNLLKNDDDDADSAATAAAASNRCGDVFSAGICAMVGRRRLCGQPYYRANCSRTCGKC